MKVYDHVPRPRKPARRRYQRYGPVFDKALRDNLILACIVFSIVSYCFYVYDQQRSHMAPSNQPPVLQNVPIMGTITRVSSDGYQLTVIDVLPSSESNGSRQGLFGDVVGDCYQIQLTVWNNYPDTSDLQVIVQVPGRHGNITVGTCSERGIAASRVQWIPLGAQGAWHAYDSTSFTPNG